jgi:hypothetical protein
MVLALALAFGAGEGLSLIGGGLAGGGDHAACPVLALGGGDLVAVDAPPKLPLNSITSPAAAAAPLAVDAAADAVH